MRNSKTYTFLAETMGRCQMFLQLFRLKETSPFWAVFARCLPIHKKTTCRPTASPRMPRHIHRCHTVNSAPRSLQPSRPQERTQSIDSFGARPFKIIFPTVPVEAGDGSTPEQSSSFPIYGGGMTKAWPIRKCRGSSLRLAAVSASTLTPYCRAIKLSVSPVLTV